MTAQAQEAVEVGQASPEEVLVAPLNDRTTEVEKQNIVNLLQTEETTSEERKRKASPSADSKPFQKQKTHNVEPHSDEMSAAP